MKKLFLKFRNIHRKPLSGLQLYLKKTQMQVFSCAYCEFYKNIYFEEHLRATASESY